VTTLIGYCDDCDAPVYDHQTRVYRVHGYEETRGAGGANKIMRREREPNLVWHPHCWDRAMARLDGGVQMTLADP